MSYLIFARTLRGTPTKVTINIGEARGDRVGTMGSVDGRAGVSSPPDGNSMGERKSGRGQTAGCSDPWAPG